MSLKQIIELTLRDYNRTHHTNETKLTSDIIREYRHNFYINQLFFTLLSIQKDILLDIDFIREMDFASYKALPHYLKSLTRTQQQKFKQKYSQFYNQFCKHNQYDFLR